MNARNYGDVKFKIPEQIAPDGGYGYVIWIAVIINLSASSAFLTSYGMVYKEILKEMKISSTKVTLLNGISTLSFAIGGFITVPLLKVTSLRKSAVFGSILFNLGVLCTIWIESQLAIFIYQGFVQSFGYGILFNISCSALNEYFTIRKLLSFTVTQTIAAGVAIASPHVIKWSSEEYGPRGKLVLVSAVSMQTFVAATLLQPVKWHLKKSAENIENANGYFLTMNEETERETDEYVDYNNKIVKTKIENVLKRGKQKRSLRELLESVFEIRNIKTFIFSNALVGTTLTTFADLQFMMMLPQAFYSEGWKEKQIAWCLSLMATGDISTRISIIVCHKYLKKFPSDRMYIAGLVVAFVTKLGMQCFRSKNIKMIFITIMGVSRCTIATLGPLVISETVEPRYFSAAMGISMLLLGLTSLVLGAAMGAVRDLSNSYSTAFYILTSCFAIVILFWIIEICYKNNVHKVGHKDIKRTNKS